MHSYKQIFTFFMEEELITYLMISSVARHISKFILLFLTVCAVMYVWYMSLHTCLLSCAVAYNVTLSAKTRIVRTSMHIEKKRNLKIICEITHSTAKYLQGLMGPAISEESFKSTKTKYHLTRLAMKNSKIFISFL